MGLRITLTLTILAVSAGISFAQQSPKKLSGNPIVQGWYADPEAKIFGNKYWVYPTYSAPYNDQVFMDAFSSPDLVNWTKHSRIVDSGSVKWVKRALWAPAIVQKAISTTCFLALTIFRTIKKRVALALPWAIRLPGHLKTF